MGKFQIVPGVLSLELIYPSGKGGKANGKRLVVHIYNILNRCVQIHNIICIKGKATKHTYGTAYSTIRGDSDAAYIFHFCLSKKYTTEN